MATLTLTQRYSGLDAWPGRIFEADESTAVRARSATSFAIQHGSESAFPGFQVVVSGTGFRYRDGVPVDGTISQVQVLNRFGAVILTIDGLEGERSTANDLGQFAFDMFGSRTQAGGPMPDGKAAWSHLMSGDDVIVGSGRDDERAVVGLDPGDDTYRMRGGRDLVNGGLGNDSIDGGRGFDTMSYAETHFNEGNSAFRGAVINTETRVALDPWGGVDSFRAMESYYGSAFADRFIGANQRADEFAGLRGRDILDGGSDSLNLDGTATGIDRRDQVSYREDFGYGGRFGIRVDLEVQVNGGSIGGTIVDGFGTTDLVYDIENVEGTRLNDVFLGSRVGNRFRGGEGKDRYDGMGGADEIDFSVHFGTKAPAVGVTVNLSLTQDQIRNDGFGNIETAFGIENVTGTSRADVIRGNASANRIQGLDGQDLLQGGRGADTFVWTRLDHFGDGDRIVDFQANDVLAFEKRNFAGMDALRLENDSVADGAQGTFLFIGEADRLVWDSNGSQDGGRYVVATITTVETLSADNFLLWD
jgi:Ca2+-binding RTX toxin-like protein